MKIGVIKYRKYEERVLLNQYFVIDDLFKIIEEEEDFMWFNIIDESGKIVLSTWFPDKEHGAGFIKVVQGKVKKEVEILGTTYDAYKTPSLTHKIRVTWKAGSYSFKRKKDAFGYAEQTNRRAKWSIEKYIE